MSGLPEVTIAGALTADPEIKYLDSGACVANFTIACNARRFDRESGQWVDGDKTFLRCSIWNHPAEHVTESLTRGLRVLATGILKQRSFETEQGDKRTITELAVTEIGPSLKFATASVTKAQRNAVAESAAPSTRTADDAEPPF